MGRCRPVRCIETGEVYPSMRNAAISTGTTASDIQASQTLISHSLTLYVDTFWLGYQGSSLDGPGGRQKLLRMNFFCSWDSRFSISTSLGPFDVSSFKSEGSNLV
eukprot:g81170.t1